MTEKKNPNQSEDYSLLDANKPITSNELEYILDVNRKSISIYNAVSQQNEDILETLDELKNVISEIKETTNDTNKIVDEQKSKIIDIDKNILRLVVILSTIGAGTIIQFILQFIHK